MGNENILWRGCAFTKFIKGIHEAWCLHVGYPTVGFWADNVGEFRKGLATLTTHVKVRKSCLQTILPVTLES